MGQISAKYFFSTRSFEIFATFHLRIFSTGPLTFPHPSASLLELQLILVKILLLVRWVSTRTQISVESETNFKYFCLKYMNHQKMEASFLFPTGLAPQCTVCHSLEILNFLIRAHLACLLLPRKILKILRQHVRHTTCLYCTQIICHLVFVTHFNE